MIEIHKNHRYIENPKNNQIIFLKQQQNEMKIYKIIEKTLACILFRPL